MAAILAKFFVALLTTWLSLELSYLAQLCIYTGATHTQVIMQLWTIFLKLELFKNVHILHLFPHAQCVLGYTLQLILIVLLVFICF